MNKKVWLGFIVVFITFEILEYIVYGLILGSAFNSLTVWRPDMSSKLWIMHVVLVFSSFFFTFIFSKGYENKGIMEGVRYGFYIGVWMSLGMAYGTYAMVDIPYSLTLEWFISGVIEFIIGGIVLALVFRPKAKEPEKA
jgi:hypothetical protein